MSGLWSSSRRMFGFSAERGNADARNTPQAKLKRAQSQYGLLGAETLATKRDGLRRALTQQKQKLGDGG